MGKAFNEKEADRIFRILLIENDIKKKHEKEIYEYYGSEKEYTNSYYKGLAEKLSDQKFELIRLYLNACLQSIGKNTDVKPQVYDSVLVFIKKEFEDIETTLRLEISSELKNKFDWLRIDGKVDEKFNNPILKFNLILLSKFKRIQRYVDDKLKVEFKNVIEKKESPSSKKTKKGCLDLCEKLLNSEYKMTDEEEKISKHKTFSKWRYDFMRDPKNDMYKNFPSIMSELEKQKFISYDEFAKIVNVPSPYYNQVLLNSFIQSCNFKGRQFAYLVKDRRLKMIEGSQGSIKGLRLTGKL